MGEHSHLANPANPANPADPAAELTFERAMSRLEEIVHELEQGSLGLQQSLEVFREGMHLVGRLGQELEKAEAQVQELVEAADGALRTRGFVADEKSTARDDV